MKWESKISISNRFLTFSKTNHKINSKSLALSLNKPKDNDKYFNKFIPLAYWNNFFNLFGISGKLSWREFRVDEPALTIAHFKSVSNPWNERMIKFLTTNVLILSFAIVMTLENVRMNQQ